jgi:hypothetical protein
MSPPSRAGKVKQQFHASPALQIDPPCVECRSSPRHSLPTTPRSLLSPTRRPIYSRTSRPYVCLLVSNIYTGSERGDPQDLGEALSFAYKRNGISCRCTMCWGWSHEENVQDIIAKVQISYPTSHVSSNSNEESQAARNAAQGTLAASGQATSTIPRSERMNKFAQDCKFEPRTSMSLSSRWGLTHLRNGTRTSNDLVPELLFRIGSAQS